MTVVTPPGVYAAQIAADFVFLDLAGDGYSCVLADDRAARREQGLAGLTPQQVEVLSDAGLLRRLDAPAHPASCAVALRDLPEVPGRSPRLADWLQVGWAHMRAAWHLRRASLVPAIATARALPVRPAADPCIVAAAVAMFDRLTIFLPRPCLCLARSLALRLYLDARGIAADWTFGVHLFPFRAHCWLAIDDCVVGDAVHRVVAYTPIMSVSGGTRSCATS